MTTVVMPDGTRITGVPEGTTQEELEQRLGLYRESVNQPLTVGAQRAVQRDLPPDVPSRFSETYDPKVSPVDFAFNRAKQAVLGIAGAPAVAFETAPPGAQMAPSILVNALRDKLGLPTNTEILRKISGILGIDPQMKAPSPGAKFATEAGIDVAQNFMFPGASTAQKVVSGVGSALGRTMSEPFGHTGEMVGSIIGGGILPALLSARTGMIWNAAKVMNRTPKELMDAAKKNPEAAGYLQQSVMRDLTDSMKADPALYRRNYEEAVELQKIIPGLKLGLGQQFRAPSIISKEQQLYHTDFPALNQAQAREQGNRQAIETALRAPSAGVTRSEAGDVFTRMASETDQPPAFPGKAWELQAAATRESSLIEGDIALKLQAAQLKVEADQALSKARTIAEKVATEADLEKLGGRAIAIRGTSGYEKDGQWIPGTGLKGAATEAAFKLKQRAVATSEQEGATYDLSGPIAKAQDMFRQPIWDDANVSAVHGKVARFVDEEGAALSSDFRSTVELREAINKDIAAALRSRSPNARSQLRNLEIMKAEVDATIQGAPFKETAKAYDDFIGYYKGTVAPRFLRGPNILAEKTTSLGEPAMPPEKVFGEYLKPGGNLPMRRYVELYGETPEAMTLMRDAILDRYTTEVIKRSGDNVIAPELHKRFLDRYRGPLEVLNRSGFTFAKELNEAATASNAALSHRAKAVETMQAAKDAHEMRVLQNRLLVQQQRMALSPVAREDSSSLRRILMDERGVRSPEDVAKSLLDDPRAMSLVLSRASPDQARAIANFSHKMIADKFSADGNITHREMTRWLNDPLASESYRTAMSRAYSPEIANAHMQTLRKINSAVERLESSPVPDRGKASDSIRLWQDALTSKLGFSWAVAFNLLRATVTTRVSPTAAGVALGAQAGQKIASNIKNDFYKDVLQSPDGARLLLNALEAPQPSTGLIRRVAEKLPRFFAYATGADRMPDMLRMATAQAGRQAVEEELTPPEQEFMP